MNTFLLPCYIQIGVKKRKRIPLNLNWYRNAHFQVLNQVKKLFQPIQGEPFQAEKIKITYTLFLATKRRTDGSNWIAVVDKFFLDYLVNVGAIPDDNWKVCSSQEWKAEYKPGLTENMIKAEVEDVSV